jgi:hypothetical protein
VNFCFENCVLSVNLDPQKMGCVESVDKESQKRNKEVEQQLKTTKSAYLNEIKLLLLGKY